VFGAYGDGGGWPEDCQNFVIGLAQRNNVRRDSLRIVLRDKLVVSFVWGVREALGLASSLGLSVGTANQLAQLLVMMIDVALPCRRRPWRKGSKVHSPRPAVPQGRRQPESPANCHTSHAPARGSHKCIVVSQPAALWAHVAFQPSDLTRIFVLQHSRELTIGPRIGLTVFDAHRPKG